MVNPDGKDPETNDASLLAPLPAAPSLINNAPWWLVSTGLHVVLVLGAALIYVEQVRAMEDTYHPTAFKPQPERFIPL